LRLAWADDARQVADNRSRVAQAAPSVVAAVRQIKQLGVAEALTTIGNWTGISLDDHQVVNVAAMTHPQGWGACVLDEQGTGKTVTTIAAFDRLVESGEINTLLLAAPKSMVGEWQAEFHRFLGDLYDVVVLDGARSARTRQLHSGGDVFVCGYETLVAHEDDMVLLAKRAKVLLVVDESHNVKNPEAARSHAARRVREYCSRCFVLCGTPAPNRAEDVVPQFDLVDFGYTFADWAPTDVPEVNRRTIAARIHERGVFTRNLKSVVLRDLPGRTVTEVPVELAPQQRRAYEAALRDLIVDLRSTSPDEFRRRILSFLERRAALLRICSNPTSLVPDYAETPAKLLALDGILDRIVSAGDKAVVWSFYRDSLNAIASRYNHFGVARIDGTVSDIGVRREAVRLFQEDEETRIFVGNPAAAGAGITLHRARVAVYESISNQAAHWMQSLDRIHRRGQTREVEYLLLVCQNTLEEVEFARVRAKAADQADLLGDPAEATPPSRTAMLEELLTYGRLIGAEA
jgi:SNF2 family DNA or RNA helicase